MFNGSDPDKALDAFDQELREPPGCPNWMHSEFWKPEGCSPNTTTTHQSEPQMDSTANASSNSEPKTTRESWTRSSKRRWRTAFTEKEFKIAIETPRGRGTWTPTRRTSTPCFNVEDDLLDPPVDAHYKRGDVWTDDPEVNWIWDGWIAEGYFHTLIAMQKVGKSTFMLNLVAELIQRTPTFLNFPPS